MNFKNALIFDILMKVAIQIQAKGIQRIFFFAMCLCACALGWSNFLMSISTIILGLTIFFKDENDKIRLINKEDINNLTNQIFKEPIPGWIILYYLIVVLSGLWSENKIEWLDQLRIQLPLLVFPLAFVAHGRLRIKEIESILFIGIFSLWIVSVYVLWNYLNHYDDMNLALLKGIPIATPISHVRFSLILACALLLLMEKLISIPFKQYSVKEYFIFLLAMYFFVLIHVLSVKSGILGLYLGIIIYLLIFAIKQKKYYILFGGLGLMVILVGLLFTFSPSLQNKYYYTLWQIGEYSRGKWLYYSDLERIKSIEMGLEMIKLHPILGSGIGDMQTVTEKAYLDHLNHRLIKYPHNQFIYSWAFCGIFSLLSLLGLFWAAFIKKNTSKFCLSFAIQGVIWSSFLYEHTLATQAGISLFLSITLLFWASQKTHRI